MARSKKEIDRELMYKKILPTAMASENTPSKAQNSSEAAESQNVAAEAIEVNIPTPVKVVVSSPLGEQRPKEQQSQPSAIAQPEKEQPRTVVKAEATTEEDVAHKACESAEEEKPEPPLVNLMETFVEKRLDSAMAKFKCCTCDRCRKEVLTIALNKLPPLYVIEDDPDIRDLHERERASQVTTALVQAVLTVKAHPVHQ